MRTKILIFALMLMSLVSYSQQDSQYTHYMYNTINVNPAYAGSRGVISIFGLHRSQWVGLDGAPETNAFSINSPIGTSNVGVGVSFVNDKIGPTDNNTISADLSYTVQTSETFKLSFGIKASGNLFNLDKEKITARDNADLLLQETSTFTPNVGAGIYFHSNKMYLGLSSPSFFSAKKYNDNDIAVYTERLTTYFIGGYVFNFGDNVKFKPAFLSKIVQGSPLQLDVSANVLFMDKFSLGAAWRWSAATSFMAGFQATKGLLIGYSYDLDTTQLAHYNSGSHEIFLRFELFNNPDRIVSPRFF